MSSSSTSDVVISKETIKRLTKDIKYIYKNPLTDHNIFYKHDGIDILKGYGVIIGPKDTIYEGGYYLFVFKFPHDYPHTPPTVTFKTSDSCTRFHPNLYISGKVCLSILNTWDGEPWTGCQTISSILLSICSLLTNDSLLCEPGITRQHNDFKQYHEIIRYKNIEFAICNFISKPYFKNEYTELFEIARTHFIEKYNYNKLLIEKSNKQFKNSKCSKNINTLIYRLNTKINYNKLPGLLEETYNSLKLN